MAAGVATAVGKLPMVGKVPMAVGVITAIPGPIRNDRIRSLIYRARMVPTTTRLASRARLAFGPRDLVASVEGHRLVSVVGQVVAAVLSSLIVPCLAHLAGTDLSQSRC